MEQAPRIWTIGHSTRKAEDFVAMLRAHGIVMLVDVRSYPGSRRFPHFNRDALARELSAAGIGYEHLPALGGRRSPRADSINTAWRNASFRGYADYMQSAEFAAAMAYLMERARAQPTAIMCAEAPWWRCHRSLIADWLKVNGWAVLHILDTRRVQRHPYTHAARIEEGRLSYR
ncbi:MAG: DUF488 domain-containing protein [Thiohalomonadaceae bacterium]